MKPPTWDDLAELRTERTPPCVSLYLPTHRAGRDMEQDPLRLRNLLDAAAAELGAGGARSAAVTQLLQPGHDLLADKAFWAHQEDGLAVFLAAGWWRALTLPYAVPEVLVTSARFHLRPLITGPQPDQEFYAITLNRRGVRLLHGGRFRLEEVELHEAPAGLEDVFSTIIEPEERQIQAHSAARAGDRETVMFHGHGLVRDTDDERLREYFRQVDASVMRVLHDRQAPLVLAGPDYLLPLYREVQTYGHALDQAAAGNTEWVDDRDLHARLWAVMEPLAEAHVRQQRAAYDERDAHGAARHGLAPVLAAAWQGRVETLFVADDAEIWGRVDEQDGTPVLHDTRRPGDEELLDRAIVTTLARGGEAYELNRLVMPRNDAVAAILRF